MKVKPVIFGISGPSLTEAEKDLFNSHPVMGFILFARNIVSKEQVKSLTSSLKNLYPNRDVPILVDQEGGKVARLKPPIFDRIHAKAEHFANLYDTGQDAAKKALADNYYSLCRNIKELGFDSPCAPVCDLRVQGANEVIGDRSFGYEEDKVVDLCKAAISGIVQAGAIPIIKHIPGHGRAMVDSHHDLPVVMDDLSLLERTDFAVFRKLSSDLKDVDMWGMTAHIIYNAIDSKNPATLSKEVINYIRTEIGFKGILLTDAIEMGALHSKIDKNSANYRQEFIANLAETSKMALEAGCSVILHCSGDIEEMTKIAGIL